MNPNKFDSFAQIVADLQNYARDEMDNNNHLFLLRIAGQIEVWGLDLFTLDYKHEGGQDWTKVLEFLLHALAYAVEQKFYPISDQQAAEYVLYGRWPQKND